MEVIYTSRVQPTVIHNQKEILPYVQTIEEYRSSLKLLVKHKDYSSAVSLAKELLDFNSYDKDALRALAIVGIQGFHWDLSDKATKALLEVSTEPADILLRIQYCFLQDKDKEVIQLAKSAAESLSVGTFDLSEIHKYLGNSLLRQGYLEDSEEAYLKAFQLNPNSDILLVNLGTLEIQRCDNERAVKYFDQALKINPKSSKAWIGLALVHRHNKDLDLAWGSLKSSLDQPCADRIAYLLCLEWAHEDARYEEAIELTRPFVLKNPQEFKPLSQFIELLIRQKLWKEAQVLLVFIRVLHSERATELASLFEIVEEKIGHSCD